MGTKIINEWILDYQQKGKDGVLDTLEIKNLDL